MMTRNDSANPNPMEGFVLGTLDLLTMLATAVAVLIAVPSLWLVDDAMFRRIVTLAIVVGATSYAVRLARKAFVRGRAIRRMREHPGLYPSLDLPDRTVLFDPETGTALTVLKPAGRAVETRSGES